MKLKNKGHKITAVAPGSIGEELELEPGDVLLTIDGEEIEDIFDYDYMTDSESFVMTIQKKKRRGMGAGDRKRRRGSGPYL